MTPTTVVLRMRVVVCFLLLPLLPALAFVLLDGGQTWQRFDTGSFDTVDCARSDACWASGEQGRAAHLVTTH